MNGTTHLTDYLKGKRLVLPALVLLAGCAGANQSANHPADYVEIQNPAFTMSPNAPETIWVPRSYVEKGVPRGRDLAKQGYDALTRSGAPQGQAPQAAQAQAAQAAHAQAAQAPAAPVPPAAQQVAPVVEPAAPVPARVTDTAGRPAPLVPHFGLVVALEGTRIYFNLGREDGIAPGQKLKVYRGGTVVKGLGLAPGETVGELEVQGYVGSNGAWGVMKQGGAARNSDLVGFE